MPQQWEPGTSYGMGDEVEYQGANYKIIQPHTSEGNWTPPATPALWGRMQGGGGQPKHHEWKPGPGGDHPHPTPHYGEQDEKHDHPEKQKHDQGWKENFEDWMTPDRKKELGIAGGVLGAAALIGGGVYAYSKHKSHEEEEVKKREWQETTTQESYEKNVAMRTQMHERGDHEQRGQKAYWTGTYGDNIPGNAIPVCTDTNGEKLYFARTFYEGGVHIGKAGRHLDGGASISYGGREMSFEKYEVLCGEPNIIRWIESRGRAEIQGFHPLEGGREQSGKFLFPVLASHQGRWVPGKLLDGDDHANAPYGGEEIYSETYKIAAYA